MTDDGDRTMVPMCEHHWISHHQPNFPPEIHWVRVCSQCGDIDGADLTRELAPLIEANRWLDAMVTAVATERDHFHEQAVEDEWCRAEDCRWRHWRSGSIPTHKRGQDCPEANRSIREDERTRHGLASVLSTLTTCDGQPHPTELHYRQADAALAWLFRLSPEASNDAPTVES